MKGLRDQMNILFAVIIALLITAMMIVLKLVAKRSTGSLSFESRGSLFTSAERSFLGLLEQAVDRRYRVFGKVRLVDLIMPINGLGAGKQTSAQNSINQKYLDFVICTANELHPVVVVELDYQSQKQKDRVENDRFLDEILKMAGIKLLRFQAMRPYTLQEIRSGLVEVISPNGKSGIVLSANSPAAPSSRVFEGEFASFPSSNRIAPECTDIS